MTETGTDPSSHAFVQTITGSETFTLTETGNPVTDTFTREILGTGTYAETLIVTIGGTPTTTTPSGNYSYGLDESANAWAGVFTQSADRGRYGLLVYFTNVANTSSGNTPGNMNFLPFGQAFVDPPEYGAGRCLDNFDAFVAGWSSRLTEGSIISMFLGDSSSNLLRARIYGETATRNHRGTWYENGQGVGFVHAELLCLLMPSGGVREK